MKEILKDFGVLVVLCIIGLVIVEVWNYFFDYKPLFGVGFFVGALYYDWYKK